MKLEHIIELDSFMTIKKMITLGNCVTFFKVNDSGRSERRSVDVSIAWNEESLAESAIDLS